ncbi:malignant fibrous histiocytoma-amplified sequence 1 homolog [Branchiostoma floridae x Branchiostoma japonicum]
MAEEPPARGTLRSRLKESDGAGSGRWSLDLSGQYLAALPPELGDITELVVLDVSRNRLESFPASTSQLSALVELNAAHNILVQVPPEVHQMSMLACLNLSCNRLTSLPDGVTQLGLLRRLVLDMNKLTNLPEGISQLSSLEELNVGGNNLSYLPEGISKLTKLKRLCADSNVLTAFPGQVLQLSGLEELLLNHNRLSDLTDNLGQMTGLKTLRLNSNRIQTLPDSVLRLSQLEELDVQNNQLGALPLGVGTLPRLATLHVSNNPLVQPPPSVCGMGIEAIRRYQDDLASATTAVPHRLKVLLVGPAAGGKSTLVRALIGGNHKNDVVATHCADIVPWNSDDNVEFSLYDTSGRGVYQAWHSWMFTPDALYLLTFNLYDLDPESSQQDVEHWLDFLNAKVPGAPVCMVGTHTDEFTAALRAKKVARKCKDLSEMAQKWNQDRGRDIEAEFEVIQGAIAIKESTSKEPVHPLSGVGLSALQRRLKHLQKLKETRIQVWEEIVPVSATTMSGIPDLRACLVTAASNSTVFPSRPRMTSVPLSWLTLEKLLQQQPEFWMRREDCGRLAVQAGVPVEQVPQVLEHLQAVGSIVMITPHHGEEKVAPNPGRLLAFLCTLVNHDTEAWLKEESARFQNFSKVQYLEARSDLLQHGVMSHSMLCALTAKYTRTTQDQVDALELLRGLGLSYSVRKTPQRKDQNSNHKNSGNDWQHCFPVYCRDSLPSEVGMRWVPLPPVNTDQLEVGCHLPFCPPGLFSHLRVAAYRHLGTERVDWQTGVLTQVADRLLILQKSSTKDGSHITVASRVCGEGRSSLWQVVLPVADILSQVLQCWPGLRHHLYVTCAHCLRKGVTNPHRFSGLLLLTTPPPGITLLDCPSTQGAQTVQAQLVYPPHRDPDQKMDSVLEVVASKLELRDWRRLGRTFGMTDAELDDIRYDFSDVQDQKYQLLWMWRRRRRSIATAKRLVSALKEIELHDLADAVRETLGYKPANQIAS